MGFFYSNLPDSNTVDLWSSPNPISIWIPLFMSQIEIIGD